MQYLLITLCAVAFLGILVLNIYFRVRVLKSYRYLYQHRVEFGAAHFFNRQKLEDEVLSRYPEHREMILAFVNNIRRSISLASVLVAIITLLGAILMFYR